MIVADGDDLIADERDIQFLDTGTDTLAINFLELEGLDENLFRELSGVVENADCVE